MTVAGCCNTNNNRGQIVGFAIDASGNSHAFLWEDSHYLDLNDLIPVQNATSINDAGEITGYGLIDGNVHGFLAFPCDHAHVNKGACHD